MEEQGEFLLAHQLGQGVDRGKVAGGQGGEGVDVVLGGAVVLGGDDVAGHVDDDDAVDADLDELFRQDFIYFFKLFLADNPIVHKATS